MQDFKTDLHFTVLTLYTLQNAAEAYLVNLFDLQLTCALYMVRGFTLMPKDFHLVQRLRDKKVEEK